MDKSQVQDYSLILLAFDYYNEVYLAEGGFGRVFKAMKNEKEYAVKIIDKEKYK